MKFTVVNLGCKVNAYEAEGTACALEERGWQRVMEEEDTDAVLVFTCAVTNTAAAKSRKSMHRMRKLHPNAVIAVIGCYVQVQDGKLNDADLLIGTAHKKEIPELLDQYMRNHRQIVAVNGLDTASFDDLEARTYENHSRAFLKVQDGCNQFCTYCVIPYVRGRERSLDPTEVVRQAEMLQETYREIVLTGIHTGRYGREYGVSLAMMMKDVLDHCPKLERLRISSIEISEVSDELIDLIKKDTRIARHLHIPLQAGSDAVLQAMHRPYSSTDYFTRLQEIRQALPDAAVSCDIIAGFPGETDGMFQEELTFVQKCDFAFMHVFPYSRREGTVAAQMEQIPPDVKKERAHILLDLVKQERAAYRDQWLGREAEVLVEQQENGMYTGYTSQYIPVLIPDDCTRGELTRVKLISRNGDIVYARRVEQ